MFRLQERQPRLPRLGSRGARMGTLPEGAQHNALCTARVPKDHFGAAGSLGRRQSSPLHQSLQPARLHTGQPPHRRQQRTSGTVDALLPQARLGDRSRCHRRARRAGHHRAGAQKTLLPSGAFSQGDGKPRAAGADLCPALRPPRHLAARYRPDHAPGLRRLRYRLGGCAAGAPERWAVPLGRLRGVRQAVHPLPRTGTRHRVRVPANRACACRSVAAGAGK